MPSVHPRVRQRRRPFVHLDMFVRTEQAACSCCGYHGVLAPTIGAIGAIGSSVPVQPCAALSLRVTVLLVVSLCLLFFGGLKPWSSEIREARTVTVDAAEAASELSSGSTALSLGGSSLEAGSSRATGTAVGARQVQSASGVASGGGAGVGAHCEAASASAPGGHRIVLSIQEPVRWNAWRRESESTMAQSCCRAGSSQMGRVSWPLSAAHKNASSGEV